MRDYAIPGKPAVVEGAIDGWEALRKWTPEFWVERYGEKRVSVSGKSYALKEIIRLALDSTPSSPAPYYRNIVLRANFPDLVPDVALIPEVCLPNWSHSWLFVPPRWATPSADPL
ncbi:MAG TPA: hypothetical protein PLX89_21150 [Verrucomicrobiota bacterium]|nr:hypothetical protein [Verrucomicrobiota bacterium]